MIPTPSVSESMTLSPPSLAHLSISHTKSHTRPLDNSQGSAGLRLSGCQARQVNSQLALSVKQPPRLAGDFQAGLAVPTTQTLAAGTLQHIILS